MFNISVDSTKSDAISELDRRLKNPFWSGFVLAWITWNWRVWYLTFFVSEEKAGNKIEEIQEMYEYTIFDFLQFFHALPGMILNWIFIPIIISAGITFLLPKLTDKFLERQKINKEREDMILRSNIKSEEQNIKVQTDLINAERDKFEAEKEKIKAQIEVEMKEKAFAWAQQEIKNTKNALGKSQDEIWDEDYLELVSKYKDILQELKSFIYHKNGRRSEYGNINALGIFDIYGLTIKGQGMYDGLEVYQLTDKGRYFLKK